MTSRLRPLAGLALLFASLAFLVGPAMEASGSTVGGLVGTSPGGRAILTSATWTSGTQVVALTGASSVSMLAVGTGASNLVQRDGSGNYPAGDGSAITNVVPFSADVWGYRWQTADGDPLSGGNGWSSAGTQTMTTASTTQDSVACYSLTPSGSAGTSYIKKSLTAATGSWELRLKIYMPPRDNTSTANRVSIVYNPDTTASGSKRFEFGFHTGSVVFWNGAANVSWSGTINNFTNRWIDLTIRVYQGAAGTANAWMQAWVGAVMIYAGPAPTLGATSPAAGDLVIGRFDTGNWTTPIYIADVALRWTGINPAPPSYTFRDATFPL